jgi:RNA recognition motif-containing protein
MGTKLYVGNLAYSVTDDRLNEIFAETGTVVSAKVIIDRATGRSKGFGFVEMSSPEEAEESIKVLSGRDNDGRALKISEAKPQAPRSSGGFERSGGFGNRNQRYRNNFG